MNKNQSPWWEHQLDEWLTKGWISKEAHMNIRNSYAAQKKGPRFTISSSIYSIVAIIGLSLIGIGVIWGAAHLWYQIAIAARMAIAVILLALSQCGVGVVLFQNREGTLWAEGMAIVHCVTVFVALAIAEQTFYIGWNTATYVAVCAVLCLPAVYLLRSLGAVVIYAVAVLAWAGLDGPVYMPGGSASIWVLVLLAVPFGQVLVRCHDEKRLQWYAWVMTVTVFLALGLASKDIPYIPFLSLSALAGVVMLLGHTVERQKAWSLPCRWIGRIAAAFALLLSCLPGSWDGIAKMSGFPVATTVVTGVLCLVMLVLLWKGVKRRLWSPVIYSAIPFIIGAETIVVRSGVYSSVPLILSTVYILLLGFYELGQGIQNAAAGSHLKFGIVMLISVVIAFLLGNSVSALVPVVLIVIVVLALVQFRRTKQAHRTAAARTARRIRFQKQHHHVQAKEQTEPAGAAKEPENVLPEWMKDIHIPSPAPKKESVPEGQVEMPAQMNTVTPKEEPKSLFVAPVFHEPDEMPLASVHIPAPAPEQPQEAPKPARKTGSPWGTSAPAHPKRKKQFTRSPWSQEGGKK